MYSTSLGSFALFAYLCRYLHNQTAYAADLLTADRADTKDRQSSMYTLALI